MRAHLAGGVPRAELAQNAALFDAHGFDVMDVFAERDAVYVEFRECFEEKRQLKDAVVGNVGVKAKESSLTDAFDAWWAVQEDGIAELAETDELMKLRADLMETFEASLVDVGLLGRFKVSGAIAAWWDDAIFDMKTLMANGFSGVVESWITSTLNTLEEEKGKARPEDYEFITRLLPDYLDQLGVAEGLVDDWDAKISEFNEGGDDDSESDGDDEDGDDDDAAPESRGDALVREIKAVSAEHSEAIKRHKVLTKTKKNGRGAKHSLGWMRDEGMNTAEVERELGELEDRLKPVLSKLERLEAEAAPYKELQNARARAVKAVKALNKEFAERLTAKQGEIDSIVARSIVLDVLKQNLGAELDRRVAEHRQLIVSAVENWWDKYRVTLRDIETERDAKLEKMKEGMLHDLLTRGIDANGELRDPVANPEQFKDSELGRIPKGWDVVRLGEVVPSAEYGISSALSERGLIPVLRMMNLAGGKVVLDDLKYSDSKKAISLALESRDVLFNRTNTFEHVGRTGIYRGPGNAVSFASYLVRLNPNMKLLTPEFLNLWLNWSRTQIRIRRYATPGVHQVNINPTNLRRNTLALPDNTEEQVRIVARVEYLDDKKTVASKELTKLRELKRGLMEDLLTGRVRVEV